MRSKDTGTVEIRVNGDAVTRICLIIAFVLPVVSLAAAAAHFRFGTIFPRLVNVDREANIPTFFSALMLLSCALMLLLTGSAARGTRFSRHWTALGVIFILLGTDEFVSVHELGINLIRRFWAPGGYLYFVWVVPGALFVAAVGIAYTRFVFSLPPGSRNRVLVAAIVYLSGALGMELIGGKYESAHNDAQDFTYAVLTSIEECLEMVGTALFLRALTRHFTAIRGRVDLTFVPGRGAADTIREFPTSRAVGE